MVNGICTSTEDFNSNLLYLGELFNHNITGVHSHSFGFVNDAIRYDYASKGFAGETAAEIQRAWDYSIGKNPQMHIFWIDHSRGAVDTNNALATYPEKHKHRITILSIAPGGFIDDPKCADITHLVCMQDPVPYLDPVGMFKCWNSIKFIKSDKNFSMDNHSMQNSLYRQKIEKAYLKFKQRHPE